MHKKRFAGQVNVDFHHGYHKAALLPGGFLDAQLQSLPAVPQCPTRRRTVEYPCSAQLQGIQAVSKFRVSLQRPKVEYQCSAQPQSIPATPQSLRCPSQNVIHNRSTPEFPLPGPTLESPFLQCPKAEGRPTRGILLNSKFPTGSPKFPAVPQSLPVPSCRYPEAPNVRASLSKNQECRVVMSPGFRITLLIHAPNFCWK